MKQPAIYIMTNERNGTLYTGVTSNLPQRVYQHKNSITKGFTSFYQCKILVYYELCFHMREAIAREKQVKAGSRQDKIMLIENLNPEWLDLYDQVCW